MPVDPLANSMTNKIIELSAERKKRRPQTYEEMAQEARKLVFDPTLPWHDADEPVDITLGRTNAQGGFIRDDDDDKLADTERDETDANK